MDFKDILWGGGTLSAPSPEASSPVPPPREEIDRFIESNRIISNELPAHTDERRLDVAQMLVDIGCCKDWALDVVTRDLC